MINEGIIKIDTDSAKELGFTSDKFNPASYLWRKDNTIFVSLIIANRKGVFCQLMKTIQEKGFDFEIPTPSGRMRQIGEKQGWRLCERDSDFGIVEVLTNKGVEK